MAIRPIAQRTLTVGRLAVEVYARRAEMGRAAAFDVAARMRALMAKQPHVRMVFAAAASQNEFLATLAEQENLDWSRVEAFHMDEYIGLDVDAPQSFGTFLREHLFDLVHPGRVEYIDPDADDPDAEAERYADLLDERPIDIVCAGIGENGHMAFNDPHVADFDDPDIAKVVDLDEVSRMQQVHDDAFATLEEVPESAVTLTMPTLMSAGAVYCIVPGPSKAEAVRRTLEEQIDEECPATVMRRHANAILYLDRDSAARIPAPAAGA